MSAEPMRTVHTAIGLMSGTSLDGIDAALVTTDGIIVSEHVAFISRAYSPEFTSNLKGAVALAHGLPEIPCGDPVVAEAAAELTRLHADAVRELLDFAGLEPGDIRVVGFHGHTVDHRPDASPAATWQIGDGALLAALAGIDVVGDFRSNDVANGGQGAPLLPFYHRALVGGQDEAVVILNIGGVANVTWIGAGNGIGNGIGNGEDAPLLAFDTGPGNALIDDWMLAHTGQSYDDNGALARTGAVSEPVLRDLLAHPYFDRPPPKSLDRDEFDTALCRGLSPEDGAATLTAFTEQAVVRALEHFSETPGRWYVTGGGRLNGLMMAGLERLLGVPVDQIEVLGVNGDAVEAEAFALLAVRSLLGLPYTFPETTGSPRALGGGVFFPKP